MLRALGEQEFGEGMQRGQAGVPGRNAVAAFAFQASQETDDPIGRDVVDHQRFDRAPAIGRGEPQEQDHTVAIASDRVTAHAAQRWKVFLEEADDRSAKVCGLVGLHDVASATMLPKAASKRLLASSRIVGTKWR